MFCEHTGHILYHKAEEPTASGKHQDPENIFLFFYFYIFFILIFYQDPEKNLHENQSLLVAEPLVATLPRPGRAWRPGP